MMTISTTIIIPAATAMIMIFLNMLNLGIFMPLKSKPIPPTNASVTPLPSVGFSR